MSLQAGEHARNPTRPSQRTQDAKGASSPLDCSSFEPLHDGLFGRHFEREVEVEERGERLGRKEVGEIGAEGRRDRGLQEDLTLAARRQQFEREQGSATSLTLSGRERGYRTP
jgi:hypothetical protein